MPSSLCRDYLGYAGSDAKVTGTLPTKKKKKGLLPVTTMLVCIEDDKVY